jgi:hypothetical protein
MVFHKSMIAVYVQDDMILYNRSTEPRQDLHVAIFVRGWDDHSLLRVDRSWGWVTATPVEIVGWVSTGADMGLVAMQ